MDFIIDKNIINNKAIIFTVKLMASIDGKRKGLECHVTSTKSYSYDWSKVYE